MSANWRINTNFVDTTASATNSLDVNGATVIVSNKGANKWILWPKGSSSDILNAYGYPSINFPQVQDALDYNNVDDLWLFSPIKTGKLGGVFVTSTGTIPFVGGTTTAAISDYTQVPCTFQIGIGNGIQTIFTGTLPNSTYYKHQSVDIVKDGTSITVAASDAEPELLTSTSLSAGSYTRATGALTATFTAAPTLGQVITATYKINIASIVYFTLFDQNAQADDLQVQVVKDTTIPGAFYITVLRYSPINEDYEEIVGSPFHVSILTNGKDGNGVPIYIENVFNTDQYLFTATVQNSTFTTFTDDTVAIALSGGSRGTAITASEIVAAYDLLKDQTQFANVEIVFDTTGEVTVATEFETLRQNYIKRCRFMLPTADLSATAIITTPLTAANNITDDRGIYYYCLTWGIHKDIYFNTDFNCSNMGLVASKMAQVLINGPGGVPAWIDENGIGGQLGSTITKLNQGASDDQLHTLDTLNFNPVVIDPIYGAMIKSWKTRNGVSSVYSYIGQSSLADWIVKIVETEILPLQIGKLNDVPHRATVSSKCTTLLTGLSKWIDEFLVVCSTDNNTAEILNAQKFVLTLGITFTAYTNQILFNFVATRQGIDVKQSIQNI